MSSFWDRPQPNRDIATTFESESTRSLRGQGHDRIHGDDPIPGIPPAMATPGVDVVEQDITAGQKMISAMSGSLLTSLLGMSSRLAHRILLIVVSQ
jgi:solute carrier family 25 protein 39/40